MRQSVFALNREKCWRASNIGTMEGSGIADRALGQIECWLRDRTELDQAARRQGTVSEGCPEVEEAALAMLMFAVVVVAVVLMIKRQAGGRSVVFIAIIVVVSFVVVMDVNAAAFVVVMVVVEGEVEPRNEGGSDKKQSCSQHPTEAEVEWRR